MLTPKISIIMPIYNTPAEYLEECLSSVFGQTFADFELLCVDDASDNEMTKALLDTYKNQHENMRVIRLEQRSGAATARNTGLSHAESEYVIFLDADDIFGDDFLLGMYRGIEENQADFCACGCMRFDDRDREHPVSCKLDKERVFYKNVDDWLASMEMVPWNKLCRRQFLLEHNIYFQSLSSSNDVFFSCMCMICAKKMCVLENVDWIYHRVGTEGQISANRNPVNLYKAMLLFLEVAPRHYSGGKLWSWGGALLIFGMLYEISRSRDEARSKELYLSVRNFFKEHPVSFEKWILRAYKNNILQLDYESRWYEGEQDFLWQIRSFAGEIKSLTAGYHDIFVWGRGKRGDAFQQFCKEEGIALSGVVDIKDSDIGETTNFGNQIFATQEILENASGLIVASNKGIYEYLRGKTGCYLMDLEEFCPMWVWN